MKTTIFLFLLAAGISLSGCSTAEQSQTQSDSSPVDTMSTPGKTDSTRIEGLKKDTMPVKKDTV
ncbi:MAG TPA: hypothetical protein DIT07_10795 [Sphingobacteriaceae bacterium]|nr:hypothetical protein [Sphingobacteriaceae bacterium]